MFGGDPGDIADHVVKKMRAVLIGDQNPVYLDQTAASLLSEARGHFSRMGLQQTSMIEVADGSFILATWQGSVKNATFALALRSHGFQVLSHDGFLEVREKDINVRPSDALRAISQETAHKIVDDGSNLLFEKFHPYLNTELLLLDALSARLDLSALKQMATDIISCEIPWILKDQSTIPIDLSK